MARAARGLSVALVAHERRQPAVREAFDARVYALSPGNVAFLKELGVWQAMPPDRLVPVHSMRIYGDEPGASLEFDAYAAGVPALAWIVEDALLQDALWQGLDAEVFAPARCAALEILAERATLRLNDGREITGKLVVGADGAQSFVRAQALIAAHEGDYAQSADRKSTRLNSSH